MCLSASLRLLVEPLKLPGLGSLFDPLDQLRVLGTALLKEILLVMGCL